MQKDFHYYATYCAAILAGYSHEDSLVICASAQMADLCTPTFLASVGGPRDAATTQSQTELVDVNPDVVGLQTITRIWASFHFLPYDLYAEKPHCSRRYLSKYRLICKPNGPLVRETVALARGRGLPAAGLAMHVLADTWAHQNFAGTPSLVINNTDAYFYELLPGPDGETERRLFFRHSPGKPDDLEKGLYTNTVYQFSEHSVMNLGHGRAGHLPDYSFMRYRYLPAWGEYAVCVKDNPSDYYQAFCQMIRALKALRGEAPEFEPDTYDYAAAAPYEERIRAILTKRQLDSCADWQAFGETLSGRAVDDLDTDRLRDEYRRADAEAKGATFLGQFFDAAIAQKSMVTNRIFRSGNLLAGFSLDDVQRSGRGWFRKGRKGGAA